jgi:hypothetical protein
VFGPNLATDMPEVVTKAGDKTKAIVVAAGGHWGKPASSKFEIRNHVNGRQQFLLYSNWQEIAIHAGGAQSRPNGATEVYSAGIYYTVLRIDPAAKALSSWDWSPYWRSRKMGKVGTDGPATSALETRYDLDAVFP